MILLLSFVFQSALTDRRFGFTNLQAARQGKVGEQCRGEDHEVVLVWSVVSGKTRVFWNKSDISHLFRETRNTEKIDLSWESRSGERFRIAAHGSPQEGFAPQYDFLLDETSIFSLSHISELTPRFTADDARSETEYDSIDDDSMVYDDVPTQNIGFRLSMAGFTPSRELQDGLVDDLTPTSFTSVLESLRGVVTELIPNSEDMVSRAIISALSSQDQFESRYSWESSSSLGSATPTAMQIEANVILDTTEWINLNVQYAPRPDVEDQKRAFMQKQMVSVFIHALKGRLDEDSAARIINSTAALLGVAVNSSIPRDTLILIDLDKTTDTDTLIAALCVYGEIRDVGMASEHRGGESF
jgi:hypothetical protein